MAAKPKITTPQTVASPEDTGPVHAASEWREHDLVIRRFHLAGLVPTEIAVVLNSKGLRVRTWAVSETFVRNRLKALGITPNLSRVVYSKGQNLYRPRAGARDTDAD